MATAQGAVAETAQASMDEMTRVPFRLLVFDFDGVILDSARIKVRGFAQLFADHPQHIEEIVSLHIRESGRSRYEQFADIYRDILRRQLAPQESKALGQRLSEICFEEILGCSPVPGAVGFLERHHGKTPVWVASGSPHDELVRTIEHRGLEGLFTGIRGAPVRKCSTIREALSVHHVLPEDALFVGDALTDLRAAEETGLAFVGVVPADGDSPFPPGTLTIPDLRSLESALVAAHANRRSPSS